MPTKTTYGDLDDAILNVLFYPQKRAEIDAETLSLSIDESAINEGREKFNALIWASMQPEGSGRLLIIKLLQLGADINSLHEIDSPLLISFQARNVLVMEMLLYFNADLSIGYIEKEKQYRRENRKYTVITKGLFHHDYYAVLTQKPDNSGITGVTPEELMCSNVLRDQFRNAHLTFITKGQKALDPKCEWEEFSRVSSCKMTTLLYAAAFESLWLHKVKADVTKKLLEYLTVRELSEMVIQYLSRYDINEILPYFDQLHKVIRERIYDNAKESYEYVANQPKLDTKSFLEFKKFGDLLPCVTKDFRVREKEKLMMLETLNFTLKEEFLKTPPSFMPYHESRLRDNKEENERIKIEEVFEAKEGEKLRK